MAVAWWSRLDPRTRRVLVVGASTYLGRLGGALAVLIYAAMAQEALGPERFGVWMWLSALLGFAAFADLGIGNALLNRVTAVWAGERAEGRRQLALELLAAWACTVAMGLALLLAWWLWWAWAADPASLVGPVAPQNRQEVLAGLNTFVWLFAINLSAGLIQRVQLGALDGHWVGVAQLVASVLTLLALPLALSMGGGLPALVWSTLGVQCLVNVASTVWWLSRQGVWAWLRRASLGRARVRALLGQGGLFFGLQLAAALAFQSDAIVISQLLGPAAYGEFSVVQRFFLLLGSGLTAAIAGLWPAFGDALIRGDQAWARRTLLNAWLWTGGLATGAVVVLVGLIEPLAWHILHLVIAPGAALLLTLAAWTVVEALGHVSGACMNGARLLRVQLLFGGATALLAFAGKWWATPIWGATGAVAATLFAYLLINVPSQVWVFRRLLWSSRTP